MAAASTGSGRRLIRGLHAKTGYAAAPAWAVDEARDRFGATTVVDVQQLALRERAVHLDWDDVRHAMNNSSTAR
ncbi:hypothetical protein [Streptomyces sp. NPDC058572]|uniref:hypothetical protein n=1 Tax=Streptomyces sp. NPDC058572 TaxID=3346546 RepID=UPI0036472641